MPAFSKSYRLIVPDLPGFGENSRIASAEFDIPSQVRRLSRFVEAVGLDWLVMLVTPFHTREELAALGSALKEEIGDGPVAWPSWPRQLPRRLLWPREASLGLRRRVVLEEASGLVAAEPLCPYPPGISLVWPGEVIDEETVRFIRILLEAGGSVAGLDPAGRVAVAA